MALEMWGSSFVVNHAGGFHAQSSIAGLKDGSFVAVWMDKTPGDDNPNEVYANRGQLFNADGTPRGNAFWIDAGPATTPGEAQPSVMALNDGRFGVGWTFYSGSSFEVVTRSFDPFTLTDGVRPAGPIGHALHVDGQGPDRGFRGGSCGRWLRDRLHGCQLTPPIWS